MVLRETIGRGSPDAGTSMPVGEAGGTHDHEHASGHSHRGGERPPTAGGRGRRMGERFFLASALDRMALALVLVGVIWLAVLWAMG